MKEPLDLPITVHLITHERARKTPQKGQIAGDLKCNGHVLRAPMGSKWLTADRGLVNSPAIMAIVGGSQQAQEAGEGLEQNRHHARLVEGLVACNVAASRFVHGFTHES
jgi:hypothetical protein